MRDEVVGRDVLHELRGIAADGHLGVRAEAGPGDQRAGGGVGVAHDVDLRRLLVQQVLVGRLQAGVGKQRVRDDAGARVAGDLDVALAREVRRRAVEAADVAVDRAHPVVVRDPNRAGCGAAAVEAAAVAVLGVAVEQDVAAALVVVEEVPRAGVAERDVSGDLQRVFPGVVRLVALGVHRPTIAAVTHRVDEDVVADRVVLVDARVRGQVVDIDVVAAPAEAHAGVRHVHQLVVLHDGASRVVHRDAHAAGELLGHVVQVVVADRVVDRDLVRVVVERQRVVHRTEHEAVAGDVSELVALDEVAVGAVVEPQAGVADVAEPAVEELDVLRAAQLHRRGRRCVVLGGALAGQFAGRWEDRRVGHVLAQALEVVAVRQRDGVARLDLGETDVGARLVPGGVRVLDARERHVGKWIGPTRLAVDDVLVDGEHEGHGRGVLTALGPVVDLVQGLVVVPVARLHELEGVLDPGGLGVRRQAWEAAGRVVVALADRRGAALGVLPAGLRHRHRGAHDAADQAAALAPGLVVVVDELDLVGVPPRRERGVRCGVAAAGEVRGRRRTGQRHGVGAPRAWHSDVIGIEPAGADPIGDVDAPAVGGVRGRRPAAQRDAAGEDGPLRTCGLPHDPGPVTAGVGRGEGERFGEVVGTSSQQHVDVRVHAGRSGPRGELRLLDRAGLVGGARSACAVRGRVDTVRRLGGSVARGADRDGCQAEHHRDDGAEIQTTPGAGAASG